MVTISGTYVFNEIIDVSSFGDVSFSSIDFTSKGSAYLGFNFKLRSGYYVLSYICGGFNIVAFDSSTNEWTSQEYRTVDFGSTPQEVTDEFYNWLIDNTDGSSSTTRTLSGTWVFNEAPDVEYSDSFTVDVNFISNGVTYNSISAMDDGVDAITYRSSNGSETVYTKYTTVYWESDSYRTITFTEEQEVSAEFYTWLTANAAQQVEEETTATATIVYNDNVIATITDGQTATLECAGMKMKGDIVIAYGVDAVNLISFTITYGVTTETYEADNGMNWEQWCESEYNTGGYYISDDNVYRSGGNSYLSDIKRTDIITSRDYGVWITNGSQSGGSGN